MRATLFFLWCKFVSSPHTLTVNVPYHVNLKTKEDDTNMCSSNLNYFIFCDRTQRHFLPRSNRVLLAAPIQRQLPADPTPEKPRSTMQTHFIHHP